jgi:hypothetical protein
VKRNENPHICACVAMREKTFVSISSAFVKLK